MYVKRTGECMQGNSAGSNPRLDQAREYMYFMIVLFFGKNGEGGRILICYHCEKNSGGHTHSHSAAYHIRTSSVILQRFGTWPSSGNNNEYSGSTCLG